MQLGTIWQHGLPLGEHIDKAMEALLREEPGKGDFYISVDGQDAALMHFVRAGEDKIIIDHTEVAEAYEGRGLGKQLVQAGVVWARKNNIKIIPLCPFAKGVFDRVAEYRDVLL